MLDILKRGLGAGPDLAPDLTRRTALAAGAALIAGPPAAAAVPAARLESRQFAYDDPRDKLKAEFRILRDFAPEADVLLWYHWTLFVVADGRKVVPLARMEGIEFSRHRKIATDLYRVHGHNLSYPRDLATGVFIDRVRNPITGKDVAIPPTVLTEDPGMLYSPAGKRPLDRKSAEFTPTYSLFRIEDDLVKLEEIRIPPDTWVTPFIEASHNWAPRKLFDNPRILRLPTGTAGGFVFPFPRWLEMDGVGGHMFGLWSGRKLDGVHQLPAEFYQRTAEQHPQLLKVDLAPFARPIP
jgi:hypothetical protein